MEKKIDELDERLRSVEGYIKMLIGGAAVLSVCVLAFVGIEYWRVPAAVDRAIRDKIDQATLDRITEAKKLADSLLQNAKDNQAWDEKTKNGFVMIGGSLLCFGSVELTPTPDSAHTYQFACRFAREFASPPSIAHAIDTEGAGYNYGVYKNKLTTVGYTGSLNEVMGRDARPVVSMTYIAIGKPK